MGGKDEDGMEEGASGSSVDGMWEREEREKVRGGGEVGLGIGGMGEKRGGGERGGWKEGRGKEGGREAGERGLGGGKWRLLPRERERNGKET